MWDDKDSQLPRLQPGSDNFISKECEWTQYMNTWEETNGGYWFLTCWIYVSWLLINTGGVPSLRPVTVLPNWLALTLPSLINIHFLLSSHSPSMGFFLIETQEFWYQPVMLHRAHPDSVTLFPCVVHLHVNISTWSLRISTVKSGTFPPLSLTKAQLFTF